MLLSTSHDYWSLILQHVLPRVDALLDVIVLWVALRLRTTSAAEQRMLSSLVIEAQRSSGGRGKTEQRRRARDRRKSSTKATTSTSPGEQERPAHEAPAGPDD